ncbi:MAG: hypothetical protein V4574_21145 [Pseudomonadota bacterium]
MHEPPPGLDDPNYAAFAWGRFRRILWWMAGASLLASAVTLLLMWWSMGEMQIVTALATIGGVFFTMMMAAGLMGLIFLSSGSGHDENVETRPHDEP